MLIESEKRCELSTNLGTGISIGARLQTVIACLCLVVQPLVFFWRTLFSRTSHLPHDILTFHLPLAAFIARCVREHTWPFWDPYAYCGTPIHADVTAQLFYPITWIALLLGNLSSGDKLFYYYQWLVPLHMILGGVFTFGLLRKLRCAAPISLLGATIYELGGYFASQAQHLGAISCGAWFPLALLCVLELRQGITVRWIGILALSCALSFLAGFPASTVVVFVVSGLFALGLVLLGIGNWRLLPILPFALLLGLAMSAVQLIPTVQLTRLSIASLRSSFRLTAGGLPLQSLASFVWPDYYHIFSGWSSTYKLPYNYTFMYIYCGHAAVLLVALLPFVKKSKELKLCIAITIISTIWMLGDQAYIYKVVDRHLPDMLRGAIYCEFVLMSFTLFVGLTSALTLQSAGNALRSWRTPIFWLIAVATSVNLIVVGSNRPMNEGDGGYKATNTETVLSGRTDIIPELHRLVDKTTPSTRTDFTPDEIHPLRAGAELFQLPSAGGDNPFMMLRYYHLRHIFAPAVPWDRRIPLINLETPWIDALNIGVIIQNVNSVMMNHVSGNKYRIVKLFPWVLAYVNRTPLSRFYLLDRVQIASDMQSALKLVGKTEFQVGREAVVETTAPIVANGNVATSSLEVVSYSENRIELHINADGPLYLVTSEAYYPGWHATINDHRAELYPTNVAFRGLPIPSGDNILVMSYWPKYFISSLIISVVATTVCACLICWQRRPPSRL